MRKMMCARDMRQGARGGADLVREELVACSV